MPTPRSDDGRLTVSGADACTAVLTPPRREAVKGCGWLADIDGSASWT